MRQLYIARGSVRELETQILLSGDRAYIQKSEFGPLLDRIAEVERMLMALIRSLEAESPSP